MVFDRKHLMTGMLVLVTISKAHLAFAGGHPGGNGHFQKSSSGKQVQMSQPHFVSKGMPQMTNKPMLPQFQQPSGLKPINKFPGTMNPGLGKGTPISLPQSGLGNIGLGKGKPVTLPQSGLGNIGLGKGTPISLPQTGKGSLNNINPILSKLPQGLGSGNNGKLPGLIGNNPVKPNFPIGKFPFPGGSSNGPITTKPFHFPGGNKFGFGIGLGGCHPHWGCGWPNYGWPNYGCYPYPNWGCTWPNYGYYPPIYGFNYPVVQSYPWPVSSPTYVTTTTPQVIEVEPTTNTTVVVNDTTPAVPPAPVAMNEIDLSLKDIRLVETATMDRGAMYRITVLNKGPKDMDTTTRMAVVAMKSPAMDAEPLHQIEMVRMLKMNESVELNVRMPVAAKDFPLLMVALEVPANFKDMNERDNMAQGEAAQIPALAAAMK